MQDSGLLRLSSFIGLHRLCQGGIRYFEQGLPVCKNMFYLSLNPEDPINPKLEATDDGMPGPLDGRTEQAFVRV